MLDENLDPIRHDEHGFTSKRFADKSANKISAAKAATGLPAAVESVPSRSPTRRRPRLELSLTQILGSAGAAVTAAFLGSRLGVAGTLIGAALASIISVVGGAIYTSSIKATRRRMAQVIVAVRNPDEDADTGAVARMAPAPPLLTPSPLTAPRHHPSNRTIRRNVDRAPDRPGRPVLRGIAVGAVLSAAVFAGAVVVVTGYETVSGTALSGGQAGGLTILGGTNLDSGSSDSRISNKSDSTNSVSTGGKGPTTTGGSEPATTAAVTPGAGTSTSKVAVSAPTSTAGSTTASNTTSGSVSTAPTTSPVTSSPVVSHPATPTASTAPTTDPTAPTAEPAAPTADPAAPTAAPAAPTAAPAAPTTKAVEPTSAAGSTSLGAADPTVTDGAASSTGSTTGPGSTQTTTLVGPRGAGTPR
ncbi:hypothetical protein ABIB25_001370 [Nakamurella sp. UYEF19]|uniref:hypothetical protein n=1 Tax=Nakamurella sp. UYEF19 TaxID=1756392 RepID=UPI0033945D50